MEYLSSEDLEELTGTPASTFRYWASINTGPPSFKLGRRRVWKRSDVEAWLEDQRGRPLQRQDRPEALNKVLGAVEALADGDYAKADSIIPATADNATVLEACGIIVRLLRETEQPAERLNALRREVSSISH